MDAATALYVAGVLVVLMCATLVIGVARHRSPR
jgi:hypothetical protein